MRQRGRRCLSVLLGAVLVVVATTGASAQRNVADYIVIKDGAFQLGGNDIRRVFSFTLPAGARLDQYAILAFMADPTEFKPTLEIQINDRTIGTYDFRTDALRAVWETFDARGVLRAGSANSMEFRVRFGRVKISDVVLWFQRSVE